MSLANVEVVRRLNEAFDARDMEVFVAAHRPDVEIVVLRSEIEGPYRGHDGLRRMATEAFESEIETRIDELRDCGNRILLLGHQHGTVRGVPFDRVLAEVYEIDAGKVARMQAFATVEQALEAAGVSE